MEVFAITVFVISEEVLKILGHKDSPQSVMTNSEVITFAVLSARYFSSNHKTARYLCKRLKLFPHILSGSRLNRRMHQVPVNQWNAVFRFLAFIFKNTNNDLCFAVDSLPILSCQKNRIDKRKIFLGKKYLGYAASKKKYFCGIKVHLIVTCEGKSVEICMMPRAQSDVNVLWQMTLDIPPGSWLCADGAYNCFDLEDTLFSEQILLLAKRGCRAKKRVRSHQEEREISSRRQIVETAFSQITSYLPQTI